MINPVLRTLRKERKRIKQLIDVDEPSEFLKGRITSVRLLLANGWTVAIKRLQGVKRQIRQARSFDDFHDWSREIEDIRSEVEGFREQYKDALVLIQNHY